MTENTMSILMILLYSTFFRLNELKHRRFRRSEVAVREFHSSSSPLCDEEGQKREELVEKDPTKVNRFYTKRSKKSKLFVTLQSGLFKDDFRNKMFQS